MPRAALGAGTARNRSSKLRWATARSVLKPSIAFGRAHGAPGKKPAAVHRSKETTRNRVRTSFILVSFTDRRVSIERKPL